MKSPPPSRDLLTATTVALVALLLLTAAGVVTQRWHPLFGLGYAVAGCILGWAAAHYSYVSPRRNRDHAQ